MCVCLCVCTACEYGKSKSITLQFQYTKLKTCKSVLELICEMDSRISHRASQSAQASQTCITFNFHLLSLAHSTSF